MLISSSCLPGCSIVLGTVDPRRLAANPDGNLPDAFTRRASVGSRVNSALSEEAGELENVGIGVTG